MNNLQSGDTVTIKLMSGEEILGRYESETADYIEIGRPRAIVNIPNKGIGLGPFVFTIPAHSSVKIFKKNVVCYAETENGMARQYTEGTTGLTLPK